MGFQASLGLLSQSLSSLFLASQRSRPQYHLETSTDERRIREIAIA